MRKASALTAGGAVRFIPAGSHQLRHIRVIGGFLDGVQLDLTDGLNCLIGARGTGKTTVLELVRYALDLVPDPQIDPETCRRVESVVQHNLGPSGRVELVYQTQNGLSYTISRGAGENPLVMTADGSATDMTLRGGTFPAAIYSQNQIERIADQALSQLSLLDNFESQPIAAIGSEIRSLTNQLATNANAILPLQEQIAALAEEIAGLPGVQEKLAALPPVVGENAEAIEQAQKSKSLRQREAQACDGLYQFLQDYDGQLEAVTGQMAAQTGQLLGQELLDGPNGATMDQIREALLAGGAEVEDLLRRARNCVGQMLAGLAETGSALQSLHAQQDLSYRELIEKDQTVRGQATERANLERLKNELLAKRRQREGLVGKLAALHKQRAELIETLSELRDRRYRIRHEVAQRINAALHPTIRVQIEQSGHLEQYRAMLEEILRGAKLKQGVVSQKIVEKLFPLELVALVRDRNLMGLKRRAGLSDDQARKVLDALADPETLFALEMAELPDKPRIELKDGASYKASSMLSTGQKCTVILPILLMDSHHPLLVDQPEDNLDNRFVCESVVESIRQVKGHRQLLFVTHNPNIPVLGDAQRVFVLESDGAQARKVAEGDVDECRDAIVNLLEGGEQAFKQRQERYAYA